MYLTKLGMPDKNNKGQIKIPPLYLALHDKES